MPRLLSAPAAAGCFAAATAAVASVVLVWMVRFAATAAVASVVLEWILLMAVAQAAVALAAELTALVLT